MSSCVNTSLVEAVCEGGWGGYLIITAAEVRDDRNRGPFTLGLR